MEKNPNISPGNKLMNISVPGEKLFQENSPGMDPWKPLDGLGRGKRLNKERPLF